MDMYNIYYIGELLYSNLNYEDSMNILRDLAETKEYDPQRIEMIKTED
jgi:hypothetical protein